MPERVLPGVVSTALTGFIDLRWQSATGFEMRTWRYAMMKEGSWDGGESCAYSVCPLCILLTCAHNK